MTADNEPIQPQVTATEQVLERLNSLILKGQPLSEGKLDYELLGKWRAQTLSLLRNALGEDSPYALHFSQATDGVEFNSGIFTTQEAWRRCQAGMGVLKAARDDVANGHLRKATMVITADVFGDFLDMSEHLVHNGFYQPAASLVGAVLEDGLRRLAVAKSVTVKGGDDLGALNSKLAQKGVYTALESKQLHFWNGIRNSADHGKWTDLKRIV